jgi:lipid-A-disaccharide synthase
MPGSRPSELRRHLGVLLEAVRLIEASGFRGRYVIPVAPSLDPAQVTRAVASAGVPVQVREGAFLPLLGAAELAVVASGTATLQAATAGVPFLVVYRVAPLSYFLARRFAYLKHLSIVNILAGKEVVPELVQERFTPARVRDEFLRLAGDPARQAAMKRELASVAARLGEPGAYERAADLFAARLSAGAKAAGAPPGPAPA